MASVEIKAKKAQVSGDLANMGHITIRVHFSAADLQLTQAHFSND